MHAFQQLSAASGSVRSLALIGALALMLFCGTSAADPLSIERVAFNSGEKAAQPSVAVDPRAGFVITWQERDRDGSALRFALLDGEGKERRRGLVSSGSGRFVNGADFPSLAVLDNSDWVTFWLQKTASGTYAYEIRTVRSRDRGRSWDEPVVVHRDGTPTEHGFVSMAPAGGDRVRMIWLDGRRMAETADAHGEGGDEHMTLRSAVLGREGKPTEEVELDSLTCACCQTDLVRTADATVAAYRDRTGTEIRDIGIVSFKGSSVTAALVHEDGWIMPGCPVNGPALAARGNRLLAVWPTMAKGAMEVRAAISSGESFDAVRTLAEGDAELGRVDAVAHGAGWLVSRVTTNDGKPAVTLTSLADDGTPAHERTIAAPAGGYPRMAVREGTSLLVFTEPGTGGDTRIAVFRTTQGHARNEREAVK